MVARTASLRRRDWLGNAAFVIPFLVIYLAFIVYPVAQAVLMSLFDWDLLGTKRSWIGLDNYTRMFGGTGIVWDIGHSAPLRACLLAAAALIGLHLWRTRRASAGQLMIVVGLLLSVILLGFHPGDGGAWNDPRFWNAFRNTVVFTVVSTPLIAALGLGFAMLVNGRHRFEGVYRAALFVPYVLPVSVATLIWGYLLNPSRGLVSELTEALGAGTVAWLSDPRVAMAAIVVTTVWWTVGFNMILFGAGLQDIDPSLYEAASLDGATRWQTFWHITRPGLRHATLLVVVTQIIASFQIFGQVHIMTSGGPGGATDVLVRYIYQTGFRDTELGYSSAMSLFLFVVMVLVSLVQFLMSRGKQA